ncbi:glycosyltransferase family 2 protein [Lacisediminihabitans profunda]|uniref:Glycosyltransferase family 2 protein n=1 Tax=Lacisediminihabitans profunda TaxID=2594790 RepID=A0A5C8UR66_9MICO|nr:glycosyltransferase [Lacisediminihabitans profunda]TXN30440.1 glycosyltransferase family 2 protein [Lacisediminihabitans profunda]
MSTSDTGAETTEIAENANHSLPRVSVVIPCHNYAQYLSEAVDSALSQTGVIVDVTIVDDASTDGSLRIAREWESQDPRVRVVAHETNKGHIITFNDALESATAPYVVKLDPDDILPDGALRRSAEVLDAHPDVAFVYGPVVNFNGAVPTHPTAVGRRRLKVWPGGRWIELRVKRVENVISQPEVMIRTSALAVSGGHRADLPAASDFNLWLRLASLGSVARIGGVVQGLYRVHSLSMQHTIHAGKIVDFHARRSAFDAFFSEAGGRVAGVESLRRANRRALASDAVRRAFEELEDGRSAQEFLDEAVDLRPDIARTSSWKNSYKRTAGLPFNGLAVRVERLRRDLSGRIRWRIWRRYGL